jgi:hypothetical protein
VHPPRRTAGCGPSLMSPSPLQRRARSRELAPRRKARRLPAVQRLVSMS